MSSLRAPYWNLEAFLFTNSLSFLNSIGSISISINRSNLKEVEEEEEEERKNNMRKIKVGIGEGSLLTSRLDLADPDGEKHLV